MVDGSRLVKQPERQTPAKRPYVAIKANTGIESLLPGVIPFSEDQFTSLCGPFEEVFDYIAEVYNWDWPTLDPKKVKTYLQNIARWLLDERSMVLYTAWED